MELARLIGYAVAILLILALLKAVLPYLIVLVTLYGAYYLLQKHSSKN